MHREPRQEAFGLITYVRSTARSVSLSHGLKCDRVVQRFHKGRTPVEQTRRAACSQMRSRRVAEIDRGLGQMRRCVRKHSQAFASVSCRAVGIPFDLQKNKSKGGHCYQGKTGFSKLVQWHYFCGH